MTKAMTFSRLDPRYTWPGFLLASGVFITLVFFLLNPSASFGMDAGMRMAFWALHVFGALAILQITLIGLMQIPAMTCAAPTLAVLMSTLVGAVLFLPIALWIERVFPVPDDEDDLPVSFWAEVGGEFLSVFPILFVVWMGLNASRLLRIENDQAEDKETEEPMPAFWDRVPRALGRDLVALSAELHYTRIYTTQGEALILFPFGQAVAELGGQGLQIHRSHWVAAAHVRKVEPRGQGGVCHLTGDIALPVSRARKADAMKLAG